MAVSRGSFLGGLVGGLAVLGLALQMGAGPEGLGDRALEAAAPQQAVASRVFVVETATAPECVGPGDGTCAWFPLGELLVIKAKQAAVCTISMTASISFGTPNQDDECDVTDLDSSVTAPGSCLSLSAGERADQTTDHRAMAKSPGARFQGICDRGKAGATKELLYLGCVQDQDCVAHGFGQSCTGSTGATLSSLEREHLEQQGAVTVVCGCEADGCVVHVRAEE